MPADTAGGGPLTAPGPPEGEGAGWVEDGRGVVAGVVVLGVVVVGGAVVEAPLAGAAIVGVAVVRAGVVCEPALECCPLVTGLDGRVVLPAAEAPVERPGACVAVEAVVLRDVPGLAGWARPRVDPLVLGRFGKSGEARRRCWGGEANTVIPTTAAARTARMATSPINRGRRREGVRGPATTVGAGSDGPGGAAAGGRSGGGAGRTTSWRMTRRGAIEARGKALATASNSWRSS